MNDLQLIQFAIAEAFDAVAFLGQAVLADQDLRASAAGSISLLATSTENPLDALTALLSNHVAVARAISRGGVYVVLAREVRSADTVD